MRLRHQNHGALQQPDPDQDHHHLERVGGGIKRQIEGAVMADHGGIDRDHNQQAGTRDDHRHRQADDASQMGGEIHRGAGFLGAARCFGGNYSGGHCARDYLK
jgi:hypothetical protein